MDFLGRISPGQPVSEAMERTFLDPLRRCFFIGGMPEAVRVHLERRDLLEVQRVQTALVQTVFVGEQLLAATPSFADPQLFCWMREARNASAELDFVIRRHQDILPVEVKAGKTGTLRSLFQFLLEKKRRRGVRFHPGRPAREEVKPPGSDTATRHLAPSCSSLTSGMPPSQPDPLSLTTARRRRNPAVESPSWDSDPRLACRW